MVHSTFISETKWQDKMTLGITTLARKEDLTKMNSIGIHNTFLQT